MRLGRPRRAAYTVSSRSAAEKYNDVAFFRAFTPYVFLRGGGDNRAYLHPFGDVAGVIQFVHYTRGKSYLIAVGRITRRRGAHEFNLRQFAFYGF